jgi:7,8-dihydropterin-6-yl-methyl-4-(beta-D-ribofuranosyl)aminobenzene 5'-phosphate synthase
MILSSLLALLVVAACSAQGAFPRSTAPVEEALASTTQSAPTATSAPLPLCTRPPTPEGPPTATPAPLADCTRSPTRASPPTATPTPQREFAELTITVLYDNTALDPELEADWGFAALLDYGGYVLLFDTGADGPTLLANMSALAVDPASIQAIVLSHSHEDHTGGLWELLATGATPTVYAPASLPAAAKARAAAQTELIEVGAEPQSIFIGVHTSGEMGDGVREQALVVETAEGLVVVTGCAHPGIVEVVRRAKDVAAAQSAGADAGEMARKVTLVVGGFHLGGASAGRVGAIIDEFRALGVERVCPTHCTGAAAIRAFAAAYGEQAIEGGVGQVIHVPDVWRPPVEGFRG